MDFISPFAHPFRAMPVFYDTHAHLDYDVYQPDFADVLARAQAAGITKIIAIGTDLASSRRALALAEQHAPIYAAVGWHPGNAHEAPADIRPELRELARHPKTVAIGEIGLDYYRLPSSQVGSARGADQTPQRGVPTAESVEDTHYKQKQAEIFRQQLEVAAETGLNCVIHQRSSFDDLFAQIQPWAKKTRGVFHCFGESVERLEKILSLGWLVSYTGIVTFKNGQNIRDAAGQVYAGNGLPVSRAGSVSRQTRRTGVCEGDFRDGRAGENDFAGSLECGHVPHGERIFPEAGVITPASMARDIRA